MPNRRQGRYNRLQIAALLGMSPKTLKRWLERDSVDFADAEQLIPWVAKRLEDRHQRAIAAIRGVLGRLL